MNIAINLLPFKEWAGGMITYIHNLLYNFGKIAPEDKFYIFTREKVLDDFQFNYPNFYYLPISIKMRAILKRIIFEQTIYAFYLRKYKIDVLFNPTPSGPQFWQGKQITVIHDCAYDRFPEEAITKFHRIYYKIIFPSTIRRSSQIVTVSNFSKKELIDIYHVKPGKIRVIYEGPPRLPNSDNEDIERVIKKFNITQPYFLFVGNHQPRKNVIGLIRAFHLLLQKKHLNILLVLTGHRDPKRVEPFIQKELHELKDKLIFTGVISRKEIAALYKKAIALTFPSFYEGFGLPVLEAQSFGLPVLTSNVSSLPEVAGKGALYVDPYDIQNIAEGMYKIFINEDLRKELMREGYENIKRFSWEKAAGELTEIFKEVYYEDSSNK